MNWGSPEIAFIIEEALREDVGPGDLTTQTLLSEPRPIEAVFVAKQDGILAGSPLLPRIFKRIDSAVSFTFQIEEGEPLLSGRQICNLRGDAAALLAGERVALNFLQRLSGIATQTAFYARQAAPFRIAVLDTRKTTPLLRMLEKYAVRVGGGKNHRGGLYDAVLVKDNHLKLQPDFGVIFAKFKAAGITADRVEIEVTDPSMLDRAIATGGSYFLLDNMTPEVIRECVQRKKTGMFFEVSGGITPENFSGYLISGVDAISIGGLTHSVKSLDISMEFQNVNV